MNFDFKLETGEIPEKEFDTIYKHIFKNCKDSHGRLYVHRGLGLFHQAVHSFRGGTLESPFWSVGPLVRLHRYILVCGANYFTSYEVKRKLYIWVRLINDFFSAEWSMHYKLKPLYSEVSVHKGKNWILYLHAVVSHTFVSLNFNLVAMPMTKQSRGMRSILWQFSSWEFWVFSLPDLNNFWVTKLLCLAIYWEVSGELTTAQRLLLFSDNELAAMPVGRSLFKESLWYGTLYMRIILLKTQCFR